MNQQEMSNVTELLEKLAAKMGTTTEYLWAVLLKQAPISAMTDLMYLIFVVLAGVVLYKLHIKFSEGKDNGRSIYWQHEEAVMIPMALAIIMWFAFCIISFISIGNMIAGFLNPEYWALHEIMSMINK